MYICIITNDRDINQIANYLLGVHMPHNINSFWYIMQAWVAAYIYAACGLFDLIIRNVKMTFLQDYGTLFV